MHRRFIVLPVLWLLQWVPAQAEVPDAESLSPGFGIVVFGGHTFELRAFPVCDGSPNGSYNVWLVTPDEEEPDVVKDGAPRLHAISDGKVSVLQFYPGGEAEPLFVRGQGDDFIPFRNGGLRYSGPIGEDRAHQIEVHVKC